MTDHLFLWIRQWSPECLHVIMNVSTTSQKMYVHKRSSYNGDDDECLHVIMNVNGTSEKMYAHLSNTQVLDSANMNHLHSHFNEFCQCWDREEIHVHQGWVHIQNNTFHETLLDENKDYWRCSLLQLFIMGIFTSNRWENVCGTSFLASSEVCLPK